MAATGNLDAYNAKRDFKVTREPAGKRQSSPGDGFSGGRFIVQKHDATRLHWDFRLEVDGVLKSWAVTRGPSLDPADKRLAVRTEDHPMDYAEFEGIIPKGQYGGGTVMLWDRGTWEPILGKSALDLDEGHLHFILRGERMRGEWLLIRLKPRPGEKRENWLLRKIEDQYARHGDGLVETGLASVLTGRTMAEIAADKAGEQSLVGKRGAAFEQTMAKAAAHNALVSKRHPGRVRAAPLPAFRPVQLATLADAVPPGEGWLHEIKFDGYRALIAAKGAEVRVYTRNGKDWTDKFGPLAAAIAALDLPACLIDGEIVANDDAGNPDFSRLQAVLKRGHGSQGAKDALEFHAFDLLSLEGKDVAPLPLLARKERLAALLADARAPVHITDHLIGEGDKLLAAMREAGQEGIIAKRIDAPYRGERTKAWLKIKCSLRQEFVVVGYIRSAAKGRGFSSLLLAQHQDGALIYKGKVGTGFDAALIDDLSARLAAIAQDRPAVDVPREEARGAMWVKPRLVAEVDFAEFTAEGRVRHASFVGLRDDKPASEVMVERATPLPERPVMPKVTNPDRVIFPDCGKTKGDLAVYCEAMAPLMLPFLANRPLSLVRCPQGVAGDCFFQKHDGGSFGPAVHRVPITEGDGGVEDYLWIDDAAGIVSCVQMGAIEFHGWGSRADAVELPDRMIFDLDPDEGLDFAAVKVAAQDIRRTLADIGLISFAMLSGGKGVHVIAPLTPGHDWATHKDFARRFAEALALSEPERFVATMSKAKRQGKIFIDWLRNQRGATAILPYSARARPGAPVAVPIGWGELDGFITAKPFSIADSDHLQRRARTAALKGWGMADQALPDL